LLRSSLRDLALYARSLRFNQRLRRSQGLCHLADHRSVASPPLWRFSPWHDQPAMA